jgi:hypothetical protein
MIVMLFVSMTLMLIAGPSSSEAAPAIYVPRLRFRASTPIKSSRPFKFNTALINAHRLRTKP